MLFDTISLQLSSQTEHWKQCGQLLLHDNFFMLRDFSFSDKEFLQTTKPYKLREGRLVHVKRGHAYYTFNLVSYHFRAGDVVVFLSDTLIEKQGHSDDFQFDAFSFPLDGRPFPNLPEFMHLSLQGGVHSVVMQHFNLMWDLAHGEPFPSENIAMLTRSLLLFINNQQPEPANERPANRQQDMLRRFVSLVSRHAAHERNIPFYAAQLCIAPHYLSTLIKEASGRTPMQWINQTAVKEIKVWLAYSDESAAQIAHRLSFPCPASLSKFFKRETGMTPGEYRQACR